MIGYEATDTITGLKGVITAKGEYMYSPHRWALTPTKLIEGKVAEGVWVDGPRLIIGKVHTPAVVRAPLIELGTKVTDTVSGFKGVATARYTYLNGCVRYEVTPPAKGGKLMDK